VKQCDVNSCDISLSNRFSVLQSDKVDNDDDDADHHGNEIQCKTKVSNICTLDVTT